MARTRNWSANTYAEVFVRLDHEQPIGDVARATGLTYQQVDYFATQLKLKPNEAPPCTNMPTPELVNEWHEKVREEIANSPTVPGPLSPERKAELDAEIAGCIELVKQAASQFGMTARRFLWECTRDARSA